MMKKEELKKKSKGAFFSNRARLTVHFAQLHSGDRMDRYRGGRGTSGFAQLEITFDMLFGRLGTSIAQ